MSARLGLALSLALALALGLAGPTQAAEPTAVEPTAVEPTIVASTTAEPDGAVLTHVYVIAPASTDPGLVAVLDAARANLQIQGVELQRVEPAPGQTAAGRARALVSGGLARGAFWLDERTPGEIRVFLLDSSGSAYVRRVPIEPTSAEASREAVWHIVESGSLALASGERVGMEEAKAEELELAPPPEPEPPPEPTPTFARRITPRLELEPEPELERARFRVAYGIAYLGGGLAREVPWSSGAAFDFTLHWRRPWALSFGYGLLLPWRRDDPVVSWRHRVEARVGPRYSVSRRVELHALAGAAMEALRWRSDSDEGWRATALATLDGSLALRLKANLWLVIQPGAEVLLNRFAFIECAAAATSCQEGATRRVVLDPWRVRPRARVGLTLQF